MVAASGARRIAVSIAVPPKRAHVADMTAGRTPYTVRRLRLLVLPLFCFFYAVSILAQDQQAPTVVTLAPAFATQASVTLRAEVNPNGLD